MKNRIFLVSGFWFLVSACTPQEQAYTPSEPHREIALRDDALLAADGMVLPLRSWRPAAAPRAVIIALHGFNDYSHAFEGIGHYFKKRDVAVVAYDQRGFGKAPQTGLWANEDNLVSDLAECVKQTRRRWPHTPIYILGESMGGAVAIVAVTDPDFPKVQGIILSAPAVWGDGTLNPAYRASLWALVHIAPSYTLTGRELKIMASDNIPMLMALGRDPLIIKHTRADAIYGMVHLMDDAYADIPKVDVPVLLLYGAHDQVIPPDPIKEARARFSIPITYNYYPDGYHLLLRDLQREVVMRDVNQWIKTSK